MIVRIIYLDGNDDIKEVVRVADICLDGVKEIKVIREKV